MSDETPTRWEKLDVILKPVGGLLTALAVTLVGIVGSQALERRETENTNSRLYAELRPDTQAVSETVHRSCTYTSRFGQRVA